MSCINPGGHPSTIDAVGRKRFLPSRRREVGKNGKIGWEKREKKRNRFPVPLYAFTHYML
jgi:hypothetical protein